MKRINPRLWTVLYAAVTLAALLLLATSLSGLRLAEGKPLPLGKLAEPLFQAGSNPDILKYLLAVFRVVMIVFWVLLPFYIIYLIVSKEARKKLLRDLAMILPMLILLYIISSNMKTQQKDGNELAGRLGLDSSKLQESAGQSITLPVFQSPPGWVTTATTLALSAAVAALIAVSIYMIWKRTRRKDDRGLTRIEREAQKAIDSLEAGGDLREVIQRCYLQMVTAVRDHRNINLNRDMTPHEFERILETRGLPAAPIQQLTLLFEQVRYGAFQPGHQEEHAAISALSAIVAACQRTSARVKEEARP